MGKRVECYWCSEFWDAHHPDCSRPPEDADPKEWARIVWKKWDVKFIERYEENPDQYSGDPFMRWKVDEWERHKETHHGWWS